VGSQPWGVSVTPDGKIVYVANYGSNTVSIIDTATNTVTATVLTDNLPTAFGQFIGNVPIWPTDQESPVGQPIILNTGGVGITVGQLNYSLSNPAFLNPGNSIATNASVFNSGTGDEKLIVSLDNATSSPSGTGDIASATTAQVWIDTSGTGTELAPVANQDYYLSPSAGMVKYVGGNIPYITLNDSSSPLTTGTATMDLPTSTSTSPYVVHYILTLGNGAGQAAENSHLTVGTSLIGRQA